MPGGGRPKGALNKKTQEVIAKAEKLGTTPLDVLLDGMIHYFNLSKQDPSTFFFIDDANQREKTIHTYRGMAKDYAIAAAPYIHPRLASLQAKVDITNVEAQLAELE